MTGEEWEKGIVTLGKEVTLLGKNGKRLYWRYVKISHYRRKSGEMGIVAVRKDVTLLEEERGNGYNGGT